MLRVAYGNTDDTDLTDFHGLFVGICSLVLRVAFGNTDDTDLTDFHGLFVGICSLVLRVAFGNTDDTDLTDFHGFFRIMNKDPCKSASSVKSVNPKNP